MTDRSRRHGDRGLTLVELLISMSLMGIVFGVVSIAFAVALQSSRESNERVASSQDGSFSANYFVRDVQAARAASVGTDEHCSASGQAVVSFEMRDVEGSAGGVSYAYAEGADGGVLSRSACGFVARELLIVARYLTALPQATCDARRCTLTVPGTDGELAISGTRRVG